MTITPVSGIRLARFNNNVSFGNREKDFNEYQPTTKSSNLKRVPVIVLIAMSPINAPNTMATTPGAYNTSGIEVYQRKQAQETHSPVQIASWNAATGNEKMKYYMFDCSGKANDAELVGFEYQKSMSNNRKGILRGFITAFSINPLPNNKYLMAYQEVDENTGKASAPRVCSVPSDFKMTLMKFQIASTDASINKSAIKYLNLTDFKKALYIKDFNDIPPIEYEYNIMRLKNGNENRVQRPSDK